MKFTKMQGCGNDYVYVNGFVEKIDTEAKPDIVRRLSDRHFGIGGDGVIFINPSEIADFEMEMFNADGSRSQMCGNGIRCVAKYVYDYGLTDKTSLTIESFGAIKYIDLTVENGKVSLVKVNMGAPILTAKDVPVLSENEQVIDEEIEVEGKNYRMTCVSMGNPHAVVYMDDVKNLDIDKVGPYFENHKRFPERVNTEFVKVIDRNTVEMRVWERGSQETAACGTGSCASVVAAVLNGYCNKGEDVTVLLRGGKLVINYTDERVYMTGEAVKVYDGVIEI